MELKLQFLALVLLSSPVLTLCDPLFVLSAPNLLRVGSSENVFVEAQDYTGGDLMVRISVKKYPKKKEEILSKTVTLTAANNFQILTDIKIPDNQNIFSDDPQKKQYVFLQAQFPTTTRENVVMVSFQSGYIFVQTDKPIYTPGSTVFYRIFSLTPNLEPLSQSKIVVEIMNSQGIIVSSEQFFSVNGITSRSYPILQSASLGIWKVVTRFSNTPHKEFTAELEVKEYVFPTIEIVLKPRKSFFHVGDQSLTVDIDAKYLFGQKVDGNAFVAFGVMDGGIKTVISNSLQKVQILKGKGTAELTNPMILQTFPDINQLVGKSLYVSVSLLTESGSEMVEAERRGIQIVTSPYTIHFRKTPHFYKPGMPFDVAVYVTNPDQSPAEHVAVEVNPGGVKGRTAANGIAKFTVNTQGESSTLEITVRTNDPKLTAADQAVRTMTAQAYISFGGRKNYLHISTDGVDLKIGDLFKVNLNTGQSPGAKNQDFTYMILSKGQIIHAGRFKRWEQSLVTLTLPVTKDMVPSFRFVAYYHVGAIEVVSDSVWVDVKDTCMGTLKVEVKDQTQFAPQDKVSLKITGDPGAKVGLVAVDKGVYDLSDKNIFTQTKIWDVIEKHDTGCTAGGGRDNKGVFTDAGLMFASGISGTTRTWKECPSLSQRRRRSEDSGSNYAYSEIFSRTWFPVSWLWEDIYLPPCTDCQTSITNKEFILKDSIATWQILAISLSKFGICVAEPEELIVSKRFFIDLKIPYSAVRGEQLKIKAVIHNYTPSNLKVGVEFLETEDVCSAASKKGKYKTSVNVDAGSSIAVSYVILPMKLGSHIIEVKAAANDCMTVYTDGVRKPLEVVSGNVLVRLVEKIVELNPAKIGGEQLEVVRAEIPQNHVLPDSPAFKYITVSGKEIEQTAKPGISGDTLIRFIVTTGGDGERNMVYMTKNLITTLYLDSTNQWDTINFDRRYHAIYNIDTGYKHQLTYRKDDGSYAIFMHRRGSTWLTAYVAKVFSMASEYVTIRDDVLCSALRWLVLNKQKTDGAFKEDVSVVYIDMVGDVQGRDADASLTAFVLVALQEGREICGDLMQSLRESIRKGIAFLEGRLPRLTNPYAVALTSYALANENKLNKEILMRHSTQSEAGICWNVLGQLAHSLEATAYAVLALVKAEDFDNAGEAVRWIGRQQFSYGVSGNTQATFMVLQALGEYYTMMKNLKPFSLDVELSFAGGSRPIKWMFNKEDVPFAQVYKAEINKDFNVTARGTGKATLSVFAEYYTKPVEKSDCKLFDFKIEQEDNAHYPGAIESYKLTVEILNTSNTVHILDISLLRGFTVNERDFIEFFTGKERYTQRFDEDKVLSVQKSVILYFNKVNNNDKFIISLKMHKLHDVDLLEPATITLYEFHLSDARCTKFYHPQRKDGALYRLKLGEQCWRAEGKCSYQKNQVRNHERLGKACEDDKTYAYKVTVVGKILDETTDIYNLQVDQVLKTGTDNVAEGQLRIFQAHPTCREALALQEFKTYLIMGSSTDLKAHGGRLQYVFGEQTWVEYWPTTEESETPEHRDRYDGIRQLVIKLYKEGCNI